jgi:5-methylcytosine-specific restriction endonuclease McrA
VYSLASYLDGAQPKPSRSERKANARREANLKRRAERQYTEEEWEALCFVWSYHCAYCGTKLPLSKLTKDHVVPISKGGANVIGNIVPACWDCNQNKGSRLYDPRPTYLMPSMEAALRQVRPEMRVALGLG